MSEEILIALKEIHARYCIPASEKNYTDKDYACMQYEKLVIHLQQEIERLNNIINDMEKEIDRLLERQYESERFAKEQGFDTYLPAKENLLCIKNKLKALKENK